MPISFANIPSNIKVPLYWVEVDPSMAGLPSLNLRGLLVGTMNSDGVALPDVPIAIGSVATAVHQFGIGSELALMFQTFFQNNFANEVWGLPVAEAVAATAATGIDHGCGAARLKPGPSISTSAAFMWLPMLVALTQPLKWR